MSSKNERRGIGFERFGGLRLDLPLDQVGAEQAAALLDVEPGQDLGLLRRRWGAKSAGPAAEAAAAYGPLARYSAGELLTTRGSTIVALNLKLGEGEVAVEKTTIAGASEVTTFAVMGTPTASYAYIAQPSKTIKRYDGTAFSEPTATVDGVAGKAMPKGEKLAVWPDGGNRLVVGGAAAGPNGAASSSSHVWFSNVGDGTSYESTAFVQVSPGDGEGISDVVVWSGMVFVFKATRLFVFYGVSVDNEGKPVFNYRTVDLGTNKGANNGALGNGTAAVAPEGVYFASSDGVWLTNGQRPVLISKPLAALAFPRRSIVGPATAIFDEALEEGGLAGRLRFNVSASLFYAKRRLFLRLVSINKTEPLLVFDIERGVWLVWRSCMNSGCEGFNGVVYFTGKSKKLLYRYDELEEADASLPAIAPMTPYWQSGFYDLGSQDEKSLVETKIMGEGTVTLLSFKDFQSESAFSKVVAMAKGQGRARAAQVGTLLSHKLELAAAAKVRRVIRYLRETRVATTQTGTK